MLKMSTVLKMMLNMKVILLLICQVEVTDDCRYQKRQGFDLSHTVHEILIVVGTAKELNPFHKQL